MEEDDDELDLTEDKKETVPVVASTEMDANKQVEDVQMSIFAKTFISF